MNLPAPRVLLSAYHCAPGMGSVSQIGWEWYSRLVKKVQVSLITHVRNRDALLQAGAPLANSEIIFIDTEWFAKPLYWLASKLFPKDEDTRFFFSSFDFYLYDWVAVRQMKMRQKAGAQWDIIHAVTPVSPIALTRLYVLNHPLILGPWNGGLKFTKAFPEIMRQEHSWLHFIRRLGRLVGLIVRSTKNAAIILTATEATLQSISARYRSRCRPFLENGVNLDLFTPVPWPTPPSSTLPLCIVFVGRFVAFKGIPMLLEAIACLKDRFPIKLTLVGDGPLREQWENHAKNLHINHLITWFGSASLTQVVEQIQAAHVLCLPSVRESGGAVLLEAMACARPVLTIKYGGPGEIADNEVGYVIPPEGGPIAVTKALVNSLSDIFEHPEVWRQRGETGRQRAERLYSWDSKINQALSLYQELLQTQ
ncbi:glycosyltransferase family 4 protein [Candidatus Parabeggiatoa sp. HSG14]|uniref:glycosyltransferase family 4 protein n=1 Tax=Candidatus Parabeggiatoa sp. HSG14 TaxID=3055593 RepID=UPI0025A87B31|nr:glycosyltransferase family 4 protein [Thiotrichales bacterium HSG14]